MIRNDRVLSIWLITRYCCTNWSCLVCRGPVWSGSKASCKIVTKLWWLKIPNPNHSTLTTGCLIPTLIVPRGRPFQGAGDNSRWEWAFRMDPSGPGAVPGTRHSWLAPLVTRPGMPPGPFGAIRKSFIPAWNSFLLKVIMLKLAQKAVFGPLYQWLKFLFFLDNLLIIPFFRRQTGSFFPDPVRYEAWNMYFCSVLASVKHILNNLAVSIFWSKSLLTKMA